MKKLAIPKSTIESLLATTDIVALVGRKVTLKTKGNGQFGIGLCPFHSEKTPSFHVSNVRRRFRCFGCSASGDAIAWMMKIEHLTFIEAVEKLSGNVSNLDTAPLTYPKPAPRPAEPGPDPEALRLWLAAIPITAPLGETYFRQHRHLSIALPASLRLGRAYHRVAGVEMPTIIAAIARPTDRKIVAVQATFLTDDGMKAPLKPSRWTFGTMGTGAIRLAPVDVVIGLAEGVETALSAMQLSGVPCWSSVGAGRLANVTVPDTVKTVHVFADNDTAGRLAAERAADRHTKAGRKVYVRFPPSQFKDYSDALMARAESERHA